MRRLALTGPTNVTILLPKIPGVLTDRANCQFHDGHEKEIEGGGEGEREWGRQRTVESLCVWGGGRKQGQGRRMGVKQSQKETDIQD